MAGMKKRLTLPFLAALAAIGASPPPQDAGAGYRSPLGSAPFGDFAFSYPQALIVLQDYVYAESSSPTAAHVVVLRHRDAEPGDLRSVEINMLRSMRQRLTCADYAVCKTVDGVVIGTDSEDKEFQRAFQEIVSSFKRRD